MTADDHRPQMRLGDLTAAQLGMTIEFRAVGCELAGKLLAVEHSHEWSRKLSGRSVVVGQARTRVELDLIGYAEPNPHTFAYWSSTPVEVLP